MERQLAEKVAVVTGASSGIGAAAARALAGAGAAVTVAARRESRLDALRSEIEGEGGRALVVPTDVGRREEVERMVARTVDAFGRVDVLV
ncbi:MAG TPA: SDR family NAD(P)-dependent oxidoreductase, partial [Longimicrobiales bacterium]|nr:SDR family NAD(P)-dependent oxidoreductase [Longimicrobiales bacterium]